MHRLKVNTVVRAATLPLETLAIDPGDVVAGAPVARISHLCETAGVSVGVWEITPGVVTDTETDEVFVVLSGVATVEFDDEEGILHLSAGSVGRLAAGTRTRWTVTETLRKVYLTTPAERLPPSAARR